MSASEWEFHIELLGKFSLLQLYLVYPFVTECHRDEVWGFEEALAEKTCLFQLFYSKSGVNHSFGAVNDFQPTSGLVYV